MPRGHMSVRRCGGESGEGPDACFSSILREGTITVSELDAFIANRVKALTEGRQHPVMSRPNAIPDFAFAVVK